jgi:hypothetical protein
MSLGAGTPVLVSGPIRPWTFSGLSLIIFCKAQKVGEEW